MSKIIKNVTASPYSIFDIGISIPANDSYLINSGQDDGLFAYSSDVIVGIGSGSLVVNDGTQDLSVSDGVKLIQNIFPNVVGLKGTDGTQINNVGDALKVSAELTIPPVGLPVSFSGGSLDAFGRIRISQIETLFEMVASGFPDFTRYITTLTSGSGTITPAINDEPSIKLGIGTSSGDSAIIRTRRFIEYNKGHSQLVLFTGRFSPGKANLRQRYGYFDNNYGLFFELDGTTLNVVKRSSLTGSIVDTKVAQSSWNVDKLDGTGVSGLTLNPSNQTVFIVDFGWLGSFKARFYIAIGDSIVLVHVMSFSNMLTLPYMDSGQAPIRAEITNTGITASSSDFFVTCAAVKSEGSEIHTGQIRDFDSGVTPVSLTTTESIIAGIRLSPDYFRGSAKIMNVSILPISGNNFVYFKLIYNPTFTQTPTWATMDGICDRITNNPTYTGGSLLDSGYIDMTNRGQGGSQTEGFIKSDVFLGSDLNGTNDALIIVARGISGSGNILWNSKYGEFI